MNRTRFGSNSNGCNNTSKLLHNPHRHHHTPTDTSCVNDSGGDNDDSDDDNKPTAPPPPTPRPPSPRTGGAAHALTVPDLGTSAPATVCSPTLRQSTANCTSASGRGTGECGGAVGWVIWSVVVPQVGLLDDPCSLIGVGEVWSDLIPAIGSALAGKVGHCHSVVTCAQQDARLFVEWLLKHPPMQFTGPGGAPIDVEPPFGAPLPSSATVSLNLLVYTPLPSLYEWYNSLSSAFLEACRGGHLTTASTLSNLIATFHSKVQFQGVALDPVAALVASCGGVDDAKSCSTAKWLVTHYALSKGAVTETSNSALKSCCASGNIRTAKFLTSNFSLTTKEEPALPKDVPQPGQHTRYFKTQNPDSGTSSDAVECLVLCCTGGHLDMMAWLVLEFSIDVSDLLSSDCDAFVRSCASGNIECVKWLALHFSLLGRPEVRSCCGPILRSCCARGKADVAQWLVDAFHLGYDEAMYVKVVHPDMQNSKVAQWIEEQKLLEEEDYLDDNEDAYADEQASTESDSDASSGISSDEEEPDAPKAEQTPTPAEPKQVPIPPLIVLNRSV
ncbi:hypothetical protein Pelo_11573 [Pelomyxa schiedti]|nr:hypothetical protein Pelo_11573 [Pelomyxa schiedti]